MFRRVVACFCAALVGQCLELLSLNTWKKRRKKQDKKWKRFIKSVFGWLLHEFVWLVGLLVGWFLLWIVCVYYILVLMMRKKNMTHPNKTPRMQEIKWAPGESPGLSKVPSFSYSCACCACTQRHLPSFCLPSTPNIIFPKFSSPRWRNNVYKLWIIICRNLMQGRSVESIREEINVRWTKRTNTKKKALCVGWVF